MSRIYIKNLNLMNKKWPKLKSKNKNLPNK